MPPIHPNTPRLHAPENPYVKPESAILAALRRINISRAFRTTDQAAESSHSGDSVRYGQHIYNNLTISSPRLRSSS